MNKPRVDVVAPTLLIGAVSLIAVAMAVWGVASWLEAASFVTGAVCVWLTVKENVWNFPIGLLNVATFSVVFFESRLFADAGLQVVYFVLGVIGWYLWLYGGEDRGALKVSRAPPAELAVLLAVMAVATIGLWRMLHVAGGSASFFDALTTSLSLGSQWLLNRKYLENWIGWIIVDVIYVPLYAYKELYLTAGLYAVFFGMAVMGLKAWRESWLSGQTAEPIGPLPGTSTL